MIVQVVTVVDSCALRTAGLIREDESRKDLVNAGIFSESAELLAPHRQEHPHAGSDLTKHRVELSLRII